MLDGVGGYRRQGEEVRRWGASWRRRPDRPGVTAVFGDQTAGERAPDWTPGLVPPEWAPSEWAPSEWARSEWVWWDRPAQSLAQGPTAPPVETVGAECVCGRVCVCPVPAGVVRSVASFVAEWHPTAVSGHNPAAEQAEDATPCRCGQTFCGYRIFARTMRRSGAYVRA